MLRQTIVRFAKEGSPEGEPSTLTFDTDSIGVNEVGLVVLTADKQVVGMFPIHALAGIYHPDGPSLITEVKGKLLV